MHARQWMATTAALVMMTAVAAPARAAVRTKVVEYAQGGTPLQGFLAWNDAVAGKRPGVIVVHEWWGHNEHARTQAKKLAEAGYVAFALDMFGKGKVTTHPEEAKAFLAEALKDPAVLGARFDAALTQLTADPHVDATKLAAIGYCFGGSVALHAARGGAPLAAVVTFHGSLATQNPAKPGSIKGRILVLHGADDPMVPPAEVEAFRKEMTAAGATFEVVTLPGAKHGFTNPDAHKAHLDGLAYDASADKQSFAAMLKLFTEVFG